MSGNIQYLPFRPYKRGEGRTHGIAEYRSYMITNALNAQAEGQELERVGGYEGVVASVQRHLPDFNPEEAVEPFAPAWLPLMPILNRCGLHLIDESTTLTVIKAYLDSAKPIADDSDLRFMRMAIEEARKSVGEDNRAHPKVGAVVVKDGTVLAAAHRGMLGKGEHAEFTALERQLPDETLAGATVYATLEPCTTRNHPKVSCAKRLIERRVRRVVFGMLDPNPRICGKGERLLRDHGIVVDRFPHKLILQLEELNREFTRAQSAAGGDANSLVTQLSADGTRSPHAPLPPYTNERSLGGLAMRVDELLLHPANMSATRELVEAWLSDPALGHVDALQFPTDPNNPADFTPDSLERERGAQEYAVLTTAQTAVILAALHDVHCPNVEPVVRGSADVSAFNEEGRMSAGFPQAVCWLAILDRVRQLGDWSLNWFILQLRRFEQFLLSVARNGTETSPAQTKSPQTSTSMAAAPTSLLKVLLESAETGTLKRKDLPLQLRDQWAIARHRQLIDLTMLEDEPCWLTPAGRAALAELREKARS